MKDFEIVVKSKHDKEIVNQCIKIAEEHHISNGGTLMFKNIIAGSKYIICAMKDKKVLGYCGMVESFAKPGDFYVMQVAVKKDITGQGIGSALFEYVKTHSRGYELITSNARKTNTYSNKLHLNAGFGQHDYGSQYFYTLATENIKNNQKIEYTDSESELE